jgi:hypothetical protein
MSDFDLPPTFFSNSSTEAFSKVMCIAWMYPIHIALAYLLVAAGAGALVSRVVPQLKWTHVYFGRTFLLTMLFAEGSAMLITNTGLPRSIIGFFVIMLVSISLGFLLIRTAQSRFADAALRRADELGDEKRFVGAKPSELVAAARQELLNAPRPWHKRFLSLKSAHGFLMTLAWWQMAGRAFVTNPADDFKGCYTYPAIKSLDGSIRLVPEHDPDFFRNEAAFFSFVTFPSIAVFILIGIAFSCIASRGWQAAAAANATAETAAANNNNNKSDGAGEKASAKTGKKSTNQQTVKVSGNETYSSIDSSETSGDADVNGQVEKVKAAL